jgi:hypothetical protein
MKGTNRNRAQAIIVSAFLIAIGIVAVVVLLNSSILSVGEQPQTTEQDVDAAASYSSTIETESREALVDVNEIAINKGLTNEEVNQTYVEYVENINERMQEVYAGQGLVGITDIRVNSSFNNAWRVRKNRTTPPTSQTRVPIDVVFVIDTSGSMSGTKIDEAKTETKSFVSSLKPLDKAGVVGFDADAGYDQEGLYQPLTMLKDNSSKDAVNSTVDQLDADGSTYLGGGIREAVDELKLNSTGSRQKVIIALADGQNTQGWFHFPDKYVCYSAGDCPPATDFYTRHEWGYSTQDICLSDDYTGSYSCSFYSLNGRDLVQAQRANRTGATIYTVGFGSGPDESHLRDVAGVTGNRTENYFFASTGSLEDAFDKILNDLTQTEPIASGVNTSYRIGLNVTDFPGRGNVTLTARENVTGSLGDVRWRMNVTNLSSSHPSPNHIVIDDGNSIVRRYDYNSLGGTPLDIDVGLDQINGYGRNMSKNLFGTNYNLTLEYSASVANVTYDIRVDRDANVTTTRCPSPPCSGSKRQTVGSIHDANFSISYSNEDIEYSEPIELVVNPVERAAQAGASPAPSPSSSTTKVLNFSTPVYDYKTYYPFDQILTDGWSDDHAFDASGNNNTMALEPDGPDISRDGVERNLNGNSDDRAYYFDGNDDYVQDFDGWNNIPIDATDEPQMFTVSLWFHGDDDGTLLDASNYGENRIFRMYIDGDDVVWEYSDSGGKVTTTRAEMSTGGGPPSWTPAPISGSNWHHAVGVGGWNNNKTQLYIADDGGLSFDNNNTQMAGKPIQEELGTGRLGSVNIGALSGGGYHFDGRIDDVRIYHQDVTELSVKSSVTQLRQDFDSGLGSWSAIPGDYAGTTDSYPASASYSVTSEWYNGITGQGVYLCCEDATSVNPPQLVSPTVDLSGNSSGTIEAWVRKGDDSFSEDPDGAGSEDLILEYEDSSGNWQVLRTYEQWNYADGEIITVSEDLPNDALHTASKFRFRLDPTNAGEWWDFWHIDNVRVTTPLSGGPSVSGNPGFVEDIHQDTRDGYITTEWQNFTDDTGLIPEPVGSGSLRLENVEAEIGDGEVSVWVQSDTDNDGAYDEQSNEIVLDGSGEHDVTGLSSNNERFRLRVAVDHSDTEDTPRFYDAQLKGST